MYLLGEEMFAVSGVVAVVMFWIDSWRCGPRPAYPGKLAYLEQVWAQIGFLVRLADLHHRLTARTSAVVDRPCSRPLAARSRIIGAFAARAAVLFGLLPILSALHLSRPVDAAYKLAITWGGLRGAVTLALALAVTENPHIDPPTQSLVAVLATGFVLFTLLVNGLTLRPVMRLPQARSALAA